MYLFLNDVAGSEILLILFFILIFFGSKSIPGIARTVGRTMRQIQDASSDIQNEIKKSTSDYKKDLNLEGIFRETSEEVRRPLDQAMTELDNSVKYTPPKRNAQIENVSEIVNPVPEESEIEKVEVLESPQNTEEKEK